MSIGNGLMVLSLLQELINVLRRRKPTYLRRAEAAHDPDDGGKTEVDAKFDWQALIR